MGWVGLLFELLLSRIIFTAPWFGLVWFGCCSYLVFTYSARKIVSKARIKSTYGFFCRAFGEQEDEGNSVGSNSLGGALADYNMQVRNTKNLTVFHDAHSDFTHRTSSACLESTARR